MSERKVTSKYYPPDFDHNEAAKLSRQFKKRTRALKSSDAAPLSSSQVKIRMMLPMSIRCTVCGEYIGRGKKFNSRKEVVQGENYLGLKVFRFYIRCTKCASELTFKTDPKNSTYVAEQNCIRNYTPWSNTTEDDWEQLEREKEMKEMEGDAMKQLENKTMEMRQEMDLLDDLDELKTISAQNRRISVDELRQRWKRMNNRKSSDNNGSSEQLLNDNEPRLTEEEELELRTFEQDLFNQQHEDDEQDDNEEEKEYMSSRSDTVQYLEVDPMSIASSSPKSESFMIGFKKRKLSQQQEQQEKEPQDENQNRGQKLENGESLTATTSTITPSNGNHGVDSNLFNGMEISVVQNQKKATKKKSSKKKSKSSALSALCQYGDED